MRLDDISGDNNADKKRREFHRLSAAALERRARFCTEGVEETTTEVREMKKSCIGSEMRKV